MSELAIAFDVETLDQALALDRRLGAGPEYAKVGLQLFAAAGPAGPAGPAAPFLTPPAAIS
jgi:orotidine-5'-phosphate decarboxylase